MFQNITRDYTEEVVYEVDNKKMDIKNIIKSAIKGQSILLYIFSLMLSCIDGLGINYSIFAIAIFAATISNGIPVGILYILTMIGTLIKFQTSGLLSYMVTTAILVILILGYKPKKLILSYENEKTKLGKYVFLSVLLGQAIKLVFQEFLVYDLLVAITSGMTAYILNIIRVYSIPLCFIGIAVGALYQYVLGTRRLDMKQKGFALIIAFVTILVICQVLPLIFAIVVKGWRG